MRLRPTPLDSLTRVLYPGARTAAGPPVVRRSPRIAAHSASVPNAGGGAVPVLVNGDAEPAHGMSDKPTTAMVLAAGLGTRMRPLTDRVPKPLVPFAGRPLIDHVLDRLADAGIADVVVNVHYLPELIENHLQGRRRPKVEISSERGELLDTGGGILRARSLLGSAPFLVHNSDSVWVEGIGSNLTRMLSTWDAERMDCLMLLALAATSIGYDGLGDFTMGADGRLTRRGERQSAPFVFAGVSIMGPSMLEGAPQGRFSLNRLWDRAAASGRLYGVRLDGVWMHIGTPEALDEAERWIAREHTR